MKEIIRKYLQKFGYDIVKTSKWYEKKSNKQVTVKVGSYNILMPGNNPQIVNYKNIPDLNSELGILTKAIAKKYPSVILVDVGANVGDTAAVVKSVINVPIIAIEGDATSFKYLEMNGKQFENIILVNKFLGESKQTISVDEHKKGWNNTIIPNKEAETELHLETLDFILDNLNQNIENLKFLKIDTEGFDTIILRGSTKLLTNSKPVIYLEYNGENMKAINEDGLSTILDLVKFGYSDIFIYDGFSNLILKTTLLNTELLTQLDNYLKFENTYLPFFDICIFHKQDTDIAMQLT